MTKSPVLSCFLGALLFAGCGKPADAPKSQSAAITNSAPPPAPAEVVASPGPGEKICFECKGEGGMPCIAPGCTNGLLDCPGPCVKLDKGIWGHTRVDGKPSDELWQIVSYKLPGGKSGRYEVSAGHAGDVIVFKDGKFSDSGKCTVCGGTGKVKCDACKGTGRVTCPVCSGKKFIPVAWTPTDNPYFNRQPDVIRLADGQVILGRVAATVGDDITIVTRDKKYLHVKASDILPGSETNAAPASAK
jgi:hypothetical protein